MPYIHFTEQEKQQANEADIVTYLNSIGETAERHGREYWWESPSGKVSIKGSDWYSQYERVGGGAVGFLQKFFGMKYPDAVRALLGQHLGELVRRYGFNQIVERIHLVTLSDKLKVRGDKDDLGAVVVLADTLGKLNARDVFHLHVK